mgnify:CR=1 FL=1
MPNTSDSQNMALFCDFENIALGVRESRYDQFDIGLILERLLLKGSIVVKKAYCDWDRYKDFKSAMHQASFEMIEIPHVRMSGKNSADIRMVVDALDLCYTKSHVDTFVIISGDSDFSPLVSKLRENNKTVIGVGVKNSTSDLLIANCDEFIFYDDLVRTRRGRSAAAAKSRAPERRKAAAPAAGKNGKEAAKEREAKEGKDGAKDKATGKDGANAGKEDKDGRKDARSTSTSLGAKPAPATSGPAPHESEPLTPDEAGIDPIGATNESSAEVEDRAARGLDLIEETLDALLEERGEDERIWGSMIKQTLKRRNPGFNELYYGYKSFNRMLEDARDRGLVELEQDDKSGGYVVRAV